MIKYQLTRESIWDSKDEALRGRRSSLPFSFDLWLKTDSWLRVLLHAKSLSRKSFVRFGLLNESVVYLCLLNDAIVHFRLVNNAFVSLPAWTVVATPSLYRLENFPNRRKILVGIDK